jgi:hypothetical protein
MDMPGTAISLGSLVLGSLQGQIGSLVHKYYDYKHKIKSLKTQALLAEMQSARSINNKRFQITRRIVVLMLVFSFCLLHFLPAFMNTPLIVFSTETNGFLLWPFIGTKSVQISQINGFVLTPEICYFTGLVMGLYCGRSDVG